MGNATVLQSYETPKRTRWRWRDEDETRDLSELAGNPEMHHDERPGIEVWSCDNLYKSSFHVVHDQRARRRLQTVSFGTISLRTLRKMAVVSEFT